MRPSLVEVLRFIKSFEGIKQAFTNGQCYWFAYILVGRFGGTIYYNPVLNHFATMITLDSGNSFLFDAEGDICPMDNASYVKWDDYESMDSTHYYRIVEQCILKNQ